MTGLRMSSLPTGHADETPAEIATANVRPTRSPLFMSHLVSNVPLGRRRAAIDLAASYGRALEKISAVAWYLRNVEQRWLFGIVGGSDWSPERGVLARLCDAASIATGLHFSPFVAATYQELVDGIADGEIGLSWLPPVPSIDLEERGLASPLAIPARGGALTYHAALIVRRGGPRTIADLRGCRAAWVDRDSSSGYLVPRLSLASQGVDVLRFFARELFVNAHARVVSAVVSGEADVGATFCNVDKAGKIVRGAWLDDHGQATRPVEAISTMGPIPNDTLVGSHELPASARATLTRWLLALDAPSRAVFEKLMGTGDLRVPSPTHYAELKHVLRAARARGHDALPPSSRMRMRVAR
jgi:phosphate/phosphite/phosphonate ABC transporter binding protein